MAAVEIDRAGGEAAPERRRQSLLAFAETKRPMETCERDVGMVGAAFRIFWREAATDHTSGDSCLEIDEWTGGLDLGEEDACSREGVQAVELEWKVREAECGEFLFDAWQRGWGEFS